MMAMIKLWKSETLRALGWKLLLQIHDEVILEGPKESLDQVSLLGRCLTVYFVSFSNSVFDVFCLLSICVCGV
jgi:DNA polymerase-1